MSLGEGLDVKCCDLEVDEFLSAASDCISFNHEISSRSASSSGVRDRF